jgi:hypothetical protein
LLALLQPRAASLSFSPSRFKKQRFFLKNREEKGKKTKILLKGRRETKGIIQWKDATDVLVKQKQLDEVP